MRRITQNGLEYLTFDNLSSVPHGSFLRHGGLSEGAFGSLNFSTSSGDISEKVILNRKKAMDCLGIKHLCHLSQEHGKTLVTADPYSTPLGDGLITNQPGLALMILHADCQAALFYDPVQQVIAAVHCGWRGNVLNIYQKTVETLEKNYGTNPHDLCVGISPSLGPNSSEFINYKEEFPPSFCQFQIGAHHFDLWNLSRWQLINAGILEQNIELAGMCTYENYDDCFSYRRAKASGRHASMIMLPERASF